MICASEQRALEALTPAQHARGSRFVDLCLSLNHGPCQGGECDDCGRCDLHASVPERALWSMLAADLAALLREYAVSS